MLDKKILRTVPADGDEDEREVHLLPAPHPGQVLTCFSLEDQCTKKFLLSYFLIRGHPSSSSGCF
jgi:hypothetical protein